MVQKLTLCCYILKQSHHHQSNTARTMENGSVGRFRRGRAVPGKVSEPQEKEAQVTVVGQGDPDTVLADAVLARWQDVAHKLHKRQHGVTIATIRAENQEKERLEKERAINTWSKVIFGIGPESRGLSVLVLRLCRLITATDELPITSIVHAYLTRCLQIYRHLGLSPPSLPSDWGG